jgi:hypothetical protein
MAAFDFVLTLLSFIYTLALTHLLMGAARMIRHRRDLIFSWPHALWMIFAFLLALANWLALWDFHNFKVMDLATFAGAVALCVAVYFISAFVTPEFEGSEDFDLVRFQDSQRATYLTAMLAMMALTFLLNIGAGEEGVSNWANQNGFVLGMMAPIVAALFVRARWVQVLAPLLEIVAIVGFALICYPRLG